MEERIEQNLWRYDLFSILAFTPFFVPTIVLFWQSKGLSMLDIYLLQGVFAVAVVCLEVPTGMVADRLGKRQSLLAAVSLYALGFCVYGLSHGFWAFLGVEILLALAMSLYSGADSALLYDTLKALGREHEYKRREGRAKGLQMASFALANLIGGFVGAYSPTLTLWLSAIGPAIGLFVVWGLVEVQEPGAKAAKEAEDTRSIRQEWQAYKTLLQESVRFVWRHQWVRWQIMFLALLTGSSTWLLWMYQPYMTYSGLPVWMFGVAFALYNLFAAMSSQMAHRLEQRCGETGSILLLFLLQLEPLLLMASVVGIWSFLFVLGHQAVRGMARPLVSDKILRYTYADKRATVLSLGSLSARLFFALTAPIVGLVTQHSSIEASLLGQAALLLVLSLALFALYLRIPRKYFAIKQAVAQRQ